VSTPSDPHENRAKRAAKRLKATWNWFRRFLDFRALVEIALTLALVCVGLSQLRVYNRQAGIMETQADISSRQVEIMQKQANISDAANRQNAAVNRAFVVASASVQQSGTGDGVKWIFETPIENSGNTPTRSMRVNFAGSTGPDVPDVPIPLGKDAEKGYAMSSAMSRAIRKSPPPIQAFLGAHARNSFIWIDLDQNQIKMIASGATQSYLYGTVHYYDVFDDTPEHITEFCYRVIVRTLPDDTQRPVPLLCDSFNCADDECPKQRREYEATVRAAYERAGKPVPPDFFAPIVSDPR
jgi:hypothetical protein